MAGMERKDIFRDTNRLYIENKSRFFSGRLFAFARNRAGKRLLDLGCGTGEYSKELKKAGFECVGADINAEYVRLARERGVEAYEIGDKLPFPDRSFDTVLLFEVLEHAADPDTLLAEARRVARRNVLITVPDNTAFVRLRGLGLTYEHMLDLDHRNFFTVSSLSGLLAKNFSSFTVRQDEPVQFHALLPWYLRKALSLLMRLKVIRLPVFFRLYAEANV